MSVNQSASDEPSRSTPQPSSEADSRRHVEELPEEEERGGIVSDGQRLPEQGGNWWQKLRLMLLGRPRDLADQSLFRSVSLVAFLAWVGLGADGLSSSCYGPSEAFAHLREHSYLALFLGMAIAATVFIIASCYPPHRRKKKRWRPPNIGNFGRIRNMHWVSAGLSRVLQPSHASPRPSSGAEGVVKTSPRSRKQNGRESCPGHARQE